MNSTEQQSWSLAVKWDCFEKAANNKIREKKIREFIKFLANNVNIEIDDAIAYVQKVKEHDFAVLRHYKVIEPCEHISEELKKEGFESIIISEDKMQKITEQCKKLEEQYQIKRWSNLYY